ncbi:MAG TPA: hypothetical protein VFO79_10215, partial [Xanthomonadales bacterium]|nr:hypothetical protein [Xanthomonadales bacterium]
MSELLRGIVGFVARLRYFVPALAVTALAAFIDHPAVLLLLLTVQPLYLAGAVSALGYLLETDFTSLTLRRGSVFLVLLVLYAGFVAVVLGTPVVRLAQEATPLNALLVSVGFALSVGVLWRTWPAFGLAFLWDDAYTDDEHGSWIVTALRRSLAFAGHLTAERDPYFGRGLPVAIGVLALVGGAMSLAGLCGLLPSELRLSALWLYAFFLSPLVHLLLAQRCERLLL